MVTDIVSRLIVKEFKSEVGFTLIELMIVVGIIGMLTAIAYPTYTEYVIKTKRTDAKDKLSEVMFEMERYNTRNRTYTLDMTDLGYAADPIQSDEGLYSIDATVCSAGSIRTCVNLTATPVATLSQKNDGALSVNTQGKRVGKWK